MRVSLAPWGEHCTECAVPECYASCDLYAARVDGKCRRFAEGIELVPDAPTAQVRFDLTTGAVDAAELFPPGKPMAMAPALTAEGMKNRAALDFFAFLGSGEAAATLESYGFLPGEKPAPP